VGEKASSEMLSSGGEESGTSFEMSPVVLGAALAAAVVLEEKSDILPQVKNYLGERGGRVYLVESRSLQDVHHCWDFPIRQRLDVQHGQGATKGCNDAKARYSAKRSEICRSSHSSGPRARPPCSALDKRRGWVSRS
jgi:hypothetical protein